MMKKPVKKVKSAFSEAQMKELMLLLNREILHREEADKHLWRQLERLKKDQKELWARLDLLAEPARIAVNQNNAAAERMRVMELELSDLKGRFDRALESTDTRFNSLFRDREKPAKPEQKMIPAPKFMVGDWVTQRGGKFRVCRSPYYSVLSARWHYEVVGSMTGMLYAFNEGELTATKKEN